MKKKALSLVLALVMCLSLFPVAAFAAVDEFTVIYDGFCYYTASNECLSAGKGEYDSFVYQYPLGTVLTAKGYVSNEPDDDFEVDDSEVYWVIHSGPKSGTRTDRLVIDSTEDVYCTLYYPYNAQTFEILYQGVATGGTTTEPAKPTEPAEPTEPAQPTEPAKPAAKKTANPTNDKLSVNGNQTEQATIYKIGGSNYFKLRDVAALLSGTSAQFNVGYDDASKTVILTTGQGYKAKKSDLKGAAKAAKQTQAGRDTILIDGVEKELKAYKIGGSNYFKLRDLGKALGFTVSYKNGVAIITTK